MEAGLGQKMEFLKGNKLKSQLNFENLGNFIASTARFLNLLDDGINVCNC